MSQTSLEFNVAWAKHFLEWFPGAKLFPSVWGPDPETGQNAHLAGIKWGKESSSDPAQIDAWARGEGLYQRNRDNLQSLYFCVNLRASGLLAVDVDIKGEKRGDEQLAALEAQHGKLPPTMTVTTPSGGLHHIFKLGKDVPSAGPLAKGAHIDLPPMVPCPGQNVPGKGHYRVKGDAITNQIPKLPDWVVEVKGTQGAKAENAASVLVEADRTDVAQAAVYLATEAPLPIAGENRNSTAFTLAADLRSRFALNHSEAVYLLESLWLPRWDGLDFADEMRKAAASAYGGNAQRAQGADNVKGIFSAIPTGAQAGLLDAGDIDTRVIPKREWLLGAWFIKRFLTVTVAPGGTGKSNHSILEALSVATGRELSGDFVHEKGNVWLHNGEDPVDEIARRIGAACSVHRIKQHELKGRFFYTSGRAMPLKLVLEANRQIYRNEPAISTARQYILENDIKLWVVDPFVDMHDCDENGNRAINAVAKALSGLADETGCAIHVVHHTKKKGKDGDPTDQDAARGASALMAAARIGRNMNSMCEKDSKNFILPMPHFWYVRLDSSKANLSSPTDNTVWFEKVDVELPNGDRVGTLKPAKLERFGAGDKNDELRKKAIELIDAAGGSLSVNQISLSLSKDKDVGVSRNTIRNRLIDEVFAHPYVNLEGAEYSLVYPPGGARNGLLIARSKPVEK